MNRYIKKGVIIGTALQLGLLSGCGYWAESTEMAGLYADVTAMEETPVVDYAVPEYDANILVDLSGYSAAERKRAALKGRELPASFRLVDAATGETVYRGKPEDAAYDEKLGLFLGYADFSDFAEEGKYYLECETIGQSCRFEIREDHFKELFLENCSKMSKACRDGTLPVSQAVLLLEAYEWYPDVFPDQNGDRTADILEDFRIWVTYMEASGTEEAESPMYAAFLAKFGYNYQNCDRQYATDCLKRASTVLGKTRQGDGSEADQFFALTELYRATGLSTYGNRIKGYKSAFEDDHISCIDETGYLFGSMTYMVTRQRVDTDLCQRFMDTIMGHAEEMSVDYQEMIDPVSDKNAGTEELLKCAAEMSCANYILNNYQYTSILEEFLHYLMGRNLRSENFYEKEEDRAEYLLLLAQLAAGTPWQEREGV